MKKIFSKYSPLNFLSLFAIIAIASYHLWKVEEITVTNIGAAMLRTLLVVGIYVAALYLLALLIKRIALIFGVNLGSWGSDAALKSFITDRRRTLARIDRGRRPLAHAKTQTLLGAALGELGRRGADTQALRESAEAFRAALPGLRQAGKSAQWALTQNNLAVTLLHLSRHETGKASLEEAVNALRTAADVWETANNMADWSQTQFHLCAVLTRLGRLEDGTARLAEAVAAGRAALTAEDNADVPLASAQFQINLSEALAFLGEREPGTERLEEAAAMAREALRVIAEDKQDLLMKNESIRWQTACQGNLGHALCCLGERSNDPDMLREAVETLRAVPPPLKDRTNTFDWAGVQDALADALRLLGEHEPGPDLLPESRTASDAALKILKRETFPFDWAVTTTTRAKTLSALGVRTGETAPLRQAVDDLKAALAVFERAETPFQSRRCRDDLDQTTALLDELTRKSPDGQAKESPPPGPMKPRPA